MPTWLHTDDRGEYRRPSIDLRTGHVIRDVAGAVVYDGITQSCRGHLALVRKGWELVRLTEAPMDVLAAQAAGA